MLSEVKKKQQRTISEFTFRRYLKSNRLMRHKPFLGVQEAACESAFSFLEYKSVSVPPLFYGVLQHGRFYCASLCLLCCRVADSGGGNCREICMERVRERERKAGDRIKIGEEMAVGLGRNGNGVKRTMNV